MDPARGLRCLLEVAVAGQGPLGPDPQLWIRGGLPLLARQPGTRRPLWAAQPSLLLFRQAKPKGAAGLLHLEQAWRRYVWCRVWPVVWYPQDFLVGVDNWGLRMSRMWQRFAWGRTVCSVVG